VKGSLFISDPQLTVANGGVPDSTAGRRVWLHVGDDCSTPLPRWSPYY